METTVLTMAVMPKDKYELAAGLLHHMCDKYAVIKLQDTVQIIFDLKNDEIVHYNRTVEQLLTIYAECSFYEVEVYAPEEKGGIRLWNL